jgi:hypothetical protein
MRTSSKAAPEAVARSCWVSGSLPVRRREEPVTGLDELAD